MRSRTGWTGLAALLGAAALASWLAPSAAVAAPVVIARTGVTAAAPAGALGDDPPPGVGEVVLYDNTGTGSTLFYAGQGGHEAIDDLHLVAGGSPDALVFEYNDPAVGGTFAATVRIYGNPSGLDLAATPLLATFEVAGLARGRQVVSLPLPGAPVVGTAIWVGVQFSSPSAGLIVSSVPSVGTSHDLYLEDGGFYNFGGSPQANFALRLVDNPLYGLSVTTVGSGLVAKNPDLPAYAPGTLVELTATADPNWHFAGWSGDAGGSDNPLSLVMDADKSVTATFALDTFTLAYTAGAGGTLSGNTAQTVAYGADGTPVTAVPDPGQVFTGWSDGVPTATRSELGVTADLDVVAHFAPEAAYTLTLDTVGSGVVTRDPDLPAYPAGARVELVAIPDPHWHLKGWSGDAGGSANPLSVTMDGDKAITATFAPDTYTLAYAAGVGGTLSGATDQFVDHGADGTAVTAVPDAGFSFAGWSDGVATATRTELAVTASLSVVASFVPVAGPAVVFDFESGLAGWRGQGGGALTLSPAGAGRGGSTYAARVVGPSSKTEFGILNSPRVLADTGPAGRRYRVTAWVRSDAGRGTARIRLREYNLTSTEQAIYSSSVTLGTAWQLLSVEIMTRQAHSSIDIQVLDRPRTASEVFLIDDVTIATEVLADQAPRVTAPSAVTAVAGALLSVDVTASDPDGQSITTLGASTFAATNPQSFTPSADRTSGRFTWMPAAAEVGGTYAVTFTAQNALGGSATMSITVVSSPPPGANLCANGTFETGKEGWTTVGNAALARVAGGRSGAWALEIRGVKKSPKVGCDDEPNWVQTTAGPGAVYRFTAWVRSQANQGSVRIQVGEFVGSQLEGATASSDAVTLSTTWQRVSLDYVVRAAGSALSLQVVDTPVSNGVAETFLVDDVVIEQVSGSALRTPAPAAAPSPAEPIALEFVRPAVYPNPAPGTATLAFSLAAPGRVRAEIYDVAGRRVRVLSAGAELAAGTHRFALERGHGAKLDAGIYFYRLQAAGAVQRGRFVVLP